MTTKTGLTVPSEFISDFIWGVARQKFHELRLQHSFSLADIKDLLDHKSLTTISRFERGEGRLGIEDVYILCALYKKQLTEIFPSNEEIEKKFSITFEAKVPHSSLSLKEWVKGEDVLIQAIRNNLKEKSK